MSFFCLTIMTFSHIICVCDSFIKQSEIKVDFGGFVVVLYACDTKIFVSQQVGASFFGRGFGCAIFIFRRN